jgi:hypothetical protein
MQSPNRPKRKFLIAGVVVLVASVLVTTFAYRIARTGISQASPASTPGPVTPAASPTRISTPTFGTTPTVSPTANPAKILGIDSIPPQLVPGLSWVRIGYPTCGGGPSGSALKNTIQSLHAQGIHVLLTTCQAASSGPRLLNTQQLDDVAQSGADAVQCGNEEMKMNAFTTYVPPANFARYFDLCARAVHAVQPNVPVLLGALDPLVSGVDYQGLSNQVNYLNAMQTAMNTQVHPGGNWTWRSQRLGLIDSWHNGYPNQYVNNLYGLLVFWAQQFHVDLNSGELGKHIWVVEGTACFQGCGIDATSPYQVAVSHILTLITDVQTTMRYHVPFFYFKTQDFVLSGTLWPMGVFDLNGHPKPIRQDLPRGSRTLVMSCSGGQVRVSDQPNLLAKLYSGCTLPGNYSSILTS